MKPKDIQLIFYLPTLRNYYDRVHLVGEIARKIGKVILVTSRIDIDVEEIGLDRQVDVIQIPGGARLPGRTALAASRVVERILEKKQFNIVHDTFGHLLPLFFRKRRFPESVFITSQYNLAEWDFRHIIWPTYGFKFLTSRDLWLIILRIFLQRSMFYLADYIVLQAPGHIDRLVQHIHISRSKIVSIPNNISESLELERETDTSIKCDNKTIRLLYVGAFTVGKGGDALLDLLDLARARNIPLQATVIGHFASITEGYMRNRIRSLNLGKRLSIKARTDRETLMEFYQNSDWLFHLTSVDGSPRVVLEALSQGLPVVGSRHPGITVLDPEAQFILFADSNEPDRILNELVAFKRDQKRYTDCSMRGKVYVRQNFISERASELYVDLYMRLLTHQVQDS